MNSMLNIRPKSSWVAYYEARGTCAQGEGWIDELQHSASCYSHRQTRVHVSRTRRHPLPLTYSSQLVLLVHLLAKPSHHSCLRPPACSCWACCCCCCRLRRKKSSPRKIKSQPKNRACTELSAELDAAHSCASRWEPRAMMARPLMAPSAHRRAARGAEDQATAGEAGKRT